MRGAVLSTLALLLAAGCADRGTARPVGSSAGASAVVASDSRGLDADVAFAQNMIPHIQEAIDLAEMALSGESAAGEPVKALAAKVNHAQSAQMTQLATWLTARGISTTMDTSGSHDMSKMPGVNAVSDMDTLTGKRGTDFDIAWLDAMIAHDGGALSMAQTERTQGQDRALKKLADEIVRSRTDEIADLRGVRGP